MRRPLRLAPTSSVDTAGAVLDALVDALLPRLRARLAVDAQGAELVDVLASIPGPRRTLLGACRSGALVGAVKVGRRWLARRAAIDGYLRARGPRPVTTPDEGDDLDEVRRSLAAPGRRRRAG